MDIAMVGLGRMGGNMARRLLRGGHRVVLYDRSAEPGTQITATEKGGAVAEKLNDLATLLKPPRYVWMMLPAGQITEDTLNNLLGILASGDTIIDGGNSNYKDSQRRAALVKSRGLNYVDVGVSGGIWGLANGYGLMIEIGRAS